MLEYHRIDVSEGIIVNKIKLFIIEEIEKKILNRAKEYYKNNKERLRQKVRSKYRKISNEEEEIIRNEWKK